MTTINRSTFAALAAGVLGLATALPATAADSIDVTVEANVVGVCKFFGGPYTVTVANSGSDIDPSLAGPATGDTGVTYRCSNGTTPVFTVPPSVTLTGAGSMLATIGSSGAVAGTGMGSGQNKTLTISGSITQAEYEDKPVGAYSNTITVDVTP